MLPTFVIGLREGMEAALIVGIVAAFLGQEGRRSALRQVWIGVSIAVAICVAIGVALQVISSDLPQRQQEGLETVVGAIAVVMVTYMVLWMRRHSRDLKGDLEQAAESALAHGSAKALVLMAFLAVLREGFETVVFLLATFHASGDATLSWLGAVLGIALAVILGYAIYKGGVRINLSRFFRITGIVLIIIAAGLAMTAIHTANEAGWLNFGQNQAFDLSWLVRPGTALSSFVTGVFGIQPYPVWVEVIGYVAYLAPMLLVMVVPQRRHRGPGPSSPPSSSSSSSPASSSALSSASSSRRQRSLVYQPVQGAHTMAPAQSDTRRIPHAARRRSSIWKLVIGCSVVGSTVVLPTLAAAPAGAAAKQLTVNVTLTPQSCSPKPAKVATGQIQFNVKNKNAGAVSEAELRTSNLSHILGEQENLTPGLSGGFALVVQPGKYVINCPGATRQHATFTVTGKSKAKSWKDSAALTSAVSGYASYINQNVATLVTTSQAMCTAINAGNQAQAELLYPQARVYYERIEPVAEVWGTLDTDIDGRIDNPVTNPADLEGFHKIEMLLWADDTLAGAPPTCSQLVTNEQQLQQLVDAASYDPVTMASGATDLINEAATSKITGEEERYSNTDFIVFQANLDAAMEVVNLLQPYLSKVSPSTLSKVNHEYQAVESAIAKYKATPGYDDTGYVEYSTVLDPQRRQLSGVVQAFAESLSKISGNVA
jgi:high-affinity iron transporter